VEAEAFPAAAMSLLEDAQNAGLTMRLDLVELAGLDGTLASLAPEKAEEMKRRVAATLRAASFGGAGASEVASERFAVITDAETPKDLLNQQLLASTEGKVAPNIAHLALDGQTAAQNMRAMRYAIDRHMEDGPQAAGQGFMATVKRTMRDTTRFRAMLETRSFQLAYQPVVKLDDGRLHHFEALARFEADSSPADTIRLAEELDLITDFDMAVAESVSETLAGAADIAPIAINVSALSLMRPAFVSALVGLTAADPALRPRLMIEITETRRLNDLDVAHNVIADLRRLKHRVCLDDFGAGAASPDYLSRLEVDFVKIDGRYVQEAHEQPRDAVVLKHLAALCRELGIATIAEMVETREGSRLAKEVGVTLGQGYYYSRPLAEPRWEPIDESAAAPARRKGMVEQWG